MKIRSILRIAVFGALLWSGLALRDQGVSEKTYGPLNGGSSGDRVRGVADESCFSFLVARCPSETGHEARTRRNGKFQKSICLPARKGGLTNCSDSESIHARTPDRIGWP